MDFKEKLAYTFEITFTAKKTDEIIEAQQNLELFSKDPMFLKTLFEIISDPNKNPETKLRLKSIKKSATLYIKKVLDERLEDEDVKHDEIFFFGQIVYEGLYNENITISNKQQLQIILNKLMLNDLSIYKNI